MSFFLVWLVLLSGSVPTHQGTRDKVQLSRNCELGVVSACRNLARLYDDGDTRDPLRAYRQLEAGCRLGDTPSCHEAANRMRDGWGTPPNLDAAMASYERYCAAGHGPSCRELGRIYRWGLRRPWDDDLAESFAEAGCEAGDGESCWILGDMLYRGETGSRDTERGEQLIERGCQLGHNVSCVHAGVLRSLASQSIRLPHPGFLLDVSSLDPSTRSHALSSLYDSYALVHHPPRPEMLPYLASALSDTDFYARQSAVVAIRFTAPPDDVPARLAMSDLLASVHGDRLEGHAARAMVDYPGNAARLIEILRAGEPDARNAAAAALGRRGPDARAAIPALRADLENEYSCIASAIALFHIDSESAGPAIPVLRRARREKNLGTAARLKAAEALIALGDVKEGTEALKQIAKSFDRSWSETEAEYKLPFLEIVERIGPAASVTMGALEKSVADPSESVRIGGARALRSVRGAAETERMLADTREEELSWALKAEDFRDSLQRMNETRVIDRIERMEPGEKPDRNIPRLLASLGDERVIERPTIDFPDYVWPAKLAGNALVAHGARAVESLIHVYAEEPDPASTNAAFALAAIGGNRALDALAAGLDDERRLLAAMALAEAGDARGLHALIEHIQSDEEYWLPAVESLGKIPDERAVGPLLELLEKRAMENAFGQTAIVKALGEIGLPRAVPALLGIAERWAQGQVIGWDAASAIASAGDLALHQVLEALRSDSVARRRAAAFTLVLFGRMDDNRGFDALIRTAAEDDSEEVRQEAMRSLEQTAHPRWFDGVLSLLTIAHSRKGAAELLSEGLRRPRPWHRRALGPLLEALAAENDEETVDVLVDVLNRLTSESRDAAGWRRWWPLNEAEWRAEQAFLEQRIRVHGRVVDESGRPLQDLQIVLSPQDSDYYPSHRRVASPAGGYTFSDAYGTLTIRRERERVSNPLAATGEDGSFEIGDWHQFVGPHGHFTLFVDTAPTRRLMRDGEPVSFRVDFSTEVVELGVVTLAPMGP